MMKLLTILFSLAVIAGCDGRDSTGTGPIPTMSISPAESVIELGDSVRLDVTVTAVDDPEVVFGTGDPSILAVGAQEHLHVWVRGIGIGTGRVTARMSDIGVVEAIVTVVTRD